MFETKIKPDYSEAIAKFVKSGGQIKQAVNTNKAEFNYCNVDTAVKSASAPIVITIISCVHVLKRVA